MLELSEIMETEVLAVAPDLTLRELVEVLHEHGVSGAPVVTNDSVIGVVSTTDILDMQEDWPIQSTRRPVTGVEEAGPPDRMAVPTSPSEFFAESWEIGALAWMRTGSGRDWDVLDEYTVSDIMTPEVLSEPPNASVKKAAQRMLESDVHRLLVIDDGELKGIVTTTDIVRAVAEGKLDG